MPAEAIAPVNATSTNTTPAPKAIPAPKPAAAKPAPETKKTPDFKSKVEETLWRVNEPTQDEVDDSKAGEDIVDKGIANAAKSSKEANPPADGLEIHQDRKPAPPPTAPDPSTQTKEKLKVGEKEFELDAEQLRRFAQKGIYHELKNRDTAKNAAELRAREEAIAAKEQYTEQVIEGLKQNTLDALVELHGEQKARELMEGWLRPKIEREMMPEEERRQLEWQERAERAEAQLQEHKKTSEQQKQNQQTEAFQEEYQQYIIQALEGGGFPKGADLTPFASEMAAWMQRGLARGITYTPERLVSLVKQDNNLRVGALTGVFVNQINEAKEKGDAQSVVKYGEQLVELLGEPVMYAIGKYHLAKMQGQQPSVPRKALDVPKVAQQASQKQNGYMSEDEYRDMRQKIARGEMEPPPGW
jgi:hypothetical protein